MKSALPAAAVLLGVLLMIASAVWPVLFPASNSWTNEKSARLSELGSQTNLLKFQWVEAQNNPRMHAGGNPAELKQKYDEARAKYDQLHAEFERVRDRPQGAARLLRWSGIGLAAVGAILGMFQRGAA